jgi:polyferredoxin
MVDEEYLGRQRWSRNKQAVFIVAWISFLVAAIGTMVFFAFFDPVDLVGTIDDGLDIGRDAGYAAGFFFFWALCALCSGVTAYLLRTAPKGNAGPRQQ